MTDGPAAFHSPRIASFGVEMAAAKARGEIFRVAWFRSLSRACPKGSGGIDDRRALMATQDAWRAAYHDEASPLAESREIAA
jgi:hypothetical protein